MESEFQHIGKKMPYTVPDGFFERITRETMQKARLRNDRRKKKIVLRRSLSIAATLTILTVTGILIFSPVPDKKTLPVAQNRSIPIPEAEPQKKVFPKKPTVQIASKSIRQISEKKDTVNGTNRSIDLVIASLSDEELLHWAMELKTDLFTEDTEY